VCLAVCVLGYRVQSSPLIRADRDLTLVVCVDATDRASWNAGVETALTLARTMTRACMASHGYALVTDSGSCDTGVSPIFTPTNKDCYWRPRTSALDLLRDDLYSETHQGISK
jgi:hypothetical protein